MLKAEYMQKLVPVYSIREEQKLKEAHMKRQKRLETDVNVATKVCTRVHHHACHASKHCSNRYCSCSSLQDLVDDPDVQQLEATLLAEKRDWYGNISSSAAAVYRAAAGYALRHLT